MNSAKKLTFAAISSALSIVLLYIASLIKTGTIAIQFITGLILMITVSKSGIAYGILSYFVTALLCLILLPDKSVAITYSIFFGTQPIIKFFAEKFSRIAEWCIKIPVIILISVLMFIIFKALLPEISAILIVIAATVAAVCYDILLSFGFAFASRYLQKPLT